MERERSVYSSSKVADENLVSQAENTVQNELSDYEKSIEDSIADSIEVTAEVTSRKKEN